MGGDDDIQRQQEHQPAEQLGKAIHRPARLPYQEEPDGDRRRERGAGRCGETEHRLEAESGARDVADIEGESPKAYQNRQSGSKAWQHSIGNRLGRDPRGDDDPPNGELGRQIEQHRDQNRKAKTRPEGRREHNGLGEEAGANCRRCHKEGGAEQDAKRRAGLIASGNDGHEDRAQR
jgi:hypothetical protein